LQPGAPISARQTLWERTSPRTWRSPKCLRSWCMATTIRSYRPLLCFQQASEKRHA